jgi:ferric-dicitrate binding protein FerR (iron transport regulator)
MHAEQLLLDERFLAWATGADDPAAANWIESLRLTSPEQEEQVFEALMTHSALHREEMPVVGMTEQLDRLMDRLDRETNVKSSEVHSKQGKFFKRLTVGVVLLLAMIFYFVQPNNNNTLVGDGKIAKLSDGTMVALGSKSTITYADGFEKRKVREVWVKGQAQFDVARKKDDQPFLVHTQAFDIEVTGTRFIVTNREQQSSVLLQEGSVNLIFPTGEIARMKPGDFFTLDARNSNQSRSPISSALVELDRQLVFENTPLIQVAKEIERRYEVDVKILTPILNEKLITGILPNNDLPALLGALQSAMDCLITQENKTIYIKSSF